MGHLRYFDAKCLDFMFDDNLLVNVFQNLKDYIIRWSYSLPRRFIHSF